MIVHAPFVHTELEGEGEAKQRKEEGKKTYDSSGFEDFEDFTVDTFPSRGMAGSLDGIDSIERILAELVDKFHEVTLDELDLALETQILDVLGGTTDLESVVVQADDVDVGKPGDLTGGTTDTTADVENTHAGLEPHLVGEVMLVTGERGNEGFALVEPREMEGLSPGELVKFSGTVIITYTRGDIN